MRKLPKIFQNEINKSINNNKTIYRVKNEDNKENNFENKKVDEVLDEIFNGIGYSYNILVTIKTISKTYETTLVARSSNNIVTIDNEIIPIKDIIYIEKKEKHL